MYNLLRRSRLALVLLVVLAGACASAESGPAESPAAGGGAQSGVTLRVHNSDGAGDRLTIYLVPNAGEHVRLGVVEPNAYLTVPYTGSQGRFQLRAQRPNGTSVTSPAFDIVSGTYTWDMALRRVDRAR